MTDITFSDKPLKAHGITTRPAWKWSSVYRAAVRKSCDPHVRGLADYQTRRSPAGKAAQLERAAKYIQWLVERGRVVLTDKQARDVRSVAGGLVDGSRHSQTLVRFLRLHDEIARAGGVAYQAAA